MMHVHLLLLLLPLLLLLLLLPLPLVLGVPGQLAVRLEPDLFAVGENCDKIIANIQVLLTGN
jgi:hypothetical protein